MPRTTKSDTDQAATDEEPSAPRTYVVLHGGVGPWWQGQQITDEHLGAVPGLNIKRLLDLGAIAEVGSEAAVAAQAQGLAATTPSGEPVTDEVPVPEGPAPAAALPPPVSGEVPGPERTTGG